MDSVVQIPQFLTDYTQEKKQYNQTIKPAGELNLFGPFVSFVMTIPSERPLSL